MTQPDDALTTSREVRDRHASRTDVLDKVKALTLLPGNTYVTTEMAAAYFEVEIEAIKKVTQRSSEELEGDGYKTIEGSELRDMKSLSGVGGRSRSLALFPRRALLRLGMLLRDSTVARQVRDYLLDAEKMPDFSTPDGQIEVLSRMLEIAKQNKALQLVNATQAKEIEAARPRVAYVDNYVNPTDDLTTVKAFAGQLCLTENELRLYLVGRKVIYRRGLWRITSKGNQERVWQWLARPKYVKWFTSRDQPEAPRLHNGQMMTTLYVTPVGKQAIRQLMERYPIGEATNDIEGEAR